MLSSLPSSYSIRQFKICVISCKIIPKMIKSDMFIYNTSLKLRQRETSMQLQCINSVINTYQLKTE